MKIVQVLKKRSMLGGHDKGQSKLKICTQILTCIRRRSIINTMREEGYLDAAPGGSYVPVG